ncbi:hypothetical protein [Actinomadura sp. BRA 177]|uniref:hypothetical protein n=1 Tax=Actinomadura sp. BRA 177 TaxID=2745202 RepID=UPI001595123A|nr:hypothetical protein [Actinomadura sp. BRA 177]NVI87814.1 hypothetical protein [Actinomadura sp. BRA 177]
MTERTPGGSADEGRREPEEQVGGAWPMPAAEDEHAEEGFRPDSPEGRGGQMEDLSPDDFE